MSLLLGDTFPDFVADTTMGKLSFYEYMGDGWGVLFSHPADFTPVCTTELNSLAAHTEDFKKRNVKVMGLSCDPVEKHMKWVKDILAYKPLAGVGDQLPYPIAADPMRDLSTKLGMLYPVSNDHDKGGLPVTCRAVFVVGPDKKLKLSIFYPATTGRDFGEVLRVIDSLQLTAYKKVATPSGWKSGEDCMILPTVLEEEARKLFPRHRKVHLPSGESYIRITPQPK